jgi:hypothetical protein
VGIFGAAEEGDVVVQDLDGVVCESCGAAGGAELADGQEGVVRQVWEQMDEACFIWELGEIKVRMSGGSDLGTIRECYLDG